MRKIVWKTRELGKRTLFNIYSFILSIFEKNLCMFVFPQNYINRLSGCRSNWRFYFLFSLFSLTQIHIIFFKKNKSATFMYEWKSTAPDWTVHHIDFYIIAAYQDPSLVTWELLCRSSKTAETAIGMIFLPNSHFIF